MESYARIRQAVLDASLNAMNMPVEWGGQGFSILQQVIALEQLGRVTNALWACVWRPAQVLEHCTPGTARALPRARVPRRAALRLRDHRAERGLRRRAPRDGGAARRRRLEHQRREVVRDRRRHRRLPDRRGRGRGRRPDLLPRRQRRRRRARDAPPALHAHVRVRAPGVRVRGLLRARRPGAGRARRRATTSPRTGSRTSG